MWGCGSQRKEGKRTSGRGSGDNAIGDPFLREGKGGET